MYLLIMVVCFFALLLLYIDSTENVCETMQQSLIVEEYSAFAMTIRTNANNYVNKYLKRLQLSFWFSVPFLTYRNLSLLFIKYKTTNGVKSN